MVSEMARVPTAHAARYLQQLCKHWSHKLDVVLDGSTGTVRFPDAVATMTAEADVLVVWVEAADGGAVERATGLVAKHLDRFAFREAPLRFDWSKD